MSVVRERVSVATAPSARTLAGSAEQPRQDLVVVAISTMSIGDFSRATHLTTKALRRYQIGWPIQRRE